MEKDTVTPWTLHIISDLFCGRKETNSENAKVGLGQGFH